MYRQCRKCGALIPASQAYCTEHRGNTSWGGGRDRARQAAFRRAVLNQAGKRCQFLLSDGQRCPAVTDLQAHHMEPGNWDPSTGVALCRAHHKAVDRHAR